MKCEFCKKEHNGDYSKRFCSATCARKYSSLKCNRKSTKTAKCIKCGTLILIPKNASEKTCKCYKCKLENGIYKFRNYNNFENQQTKYIKYCKITGLELTKCDDCFFKQNGLCKNLNGIIQRFNNIQSIEPFEFDKSSLGTLKVIDEYKRIQSLLYDMYYEQNLSSEDIEKLCGKRVEDIIRKFFKIHFRNFSDSVRNAILQGKHVLPDVGQYKTEWHKTWNDKEYFLRSSYETDYANLLDEQHINYEVEELKIKYFDSIQNKYRLAIPDFYLPESNTIVEIKSWYTLDIQNMKDKVKRYKELGYNFKLILEHEEIDINTING